MEPYEPSATILLNRAFVKKYCSKDELLFIVLTHELLHHAKAHLQMKVAKEDFIIWNIAFDCVINYHMQFMDSIASSRLNHILLQLHSKKPLGPVLVPQNLIEDAKKGKEPGKVLVPLVREERLYDAFLYLKQYFESKGVKFKSSILDLLIGSHKRSGKTKKVKVSSAMAKRILAELTSRLPGYAERLDESYSKIRETEAYKKILKLVKPILQAYDGKVKTVVPRNLTRLGLIWMYLGYTPTFYEMEQYKAKREEVTIFLDVSGSMDKEIPVLLGIAQLLALHIEVEFFQFSNKVAPFTMDDLRRGRIKTTWGTDFNCILETILGRKAIHSIIITDGYASAKPELIKRVLATRGPIDGVVIGGTNADELSKFCKSITKISDKELQGVWKRE